MAEAKIVSPDYNQKSLELQAKLLEDMEITQVRQRLVTPKLHEIEDKVIEAIGDAVDDERMTPYKAAMAYGKIVDTHIKFAQLQMSMYDRLQGATMLGISAQELDFPITQEQEQAVDLEKERAAEQLCISIINYQAELTRRLKDAERLKKETEKEQRKQA